jgi:uncharacterized protein YaeQ
MTFVSGFYSFIVELSDTDAGRYATLRFKLARHPEETEDLLLARTIAYIHVYQSDLAFSLGLFEPKEPTIWRHSPTEQLLTWVEVGVPSHEKIERALRHHSSAQFSIYFYDRSQVPQFCHYLRGSKTNWVSDVSFFSIDPELLTKLSATLTSSNRWTVTLSEGGLFIEANKIQFESSIKPVDIWNEYQSSLIPSR